MGLAIVDQIIIEHNGTIGVQSKVGEGAHFYHPTSGSEQFTGVEEPCLDLRSVALLSGRGGYCAKKERSTQNIGRFCHPLDFFTGIGITATEKKIGVSL